jgi:hypothetical protein
VPWDGSLDGFVLQYANTFLPHALLTLYPADELTTQPNQGRPSICVHSSTEERGDLHSSGTHDPFATSLPGYGALPCCLNCEQPTAASCAHTLLCPWPAYLCWLTQICQRCASLTRRAAPEGYPWPRSVATSSTSWLCAHCAT